MGNWPKITTGSAYTEMATSSLNIIRIFRNGDLGLIAAAFGAHIFK